MMKETSISAKQSNEMDIPRNRFGMHYFKSPQLKGLALTRPMSLHNLKPYLSNPLNKKRSRSDLKIKFDDDTDSEVSIPIKKSKFRSRIVVSCAVLIVLVLLLMIGISCLMPESIKMLFGIMTGDSMSSSPDIYPTMMPARPPTPLRPPPGPPPSPQ